MFRNPGAFLLPWRKRSGRMEMRGSQLGIKVGVTMIESYRFGYIVVDGKSYTSDVIIYPDRVDANWWRKEGHRLAPEDLKGVVAEEARTIIVGTGTSELMRVPPETLEYLTSKGFEVIVQNTNDACQTYNRMAQQGAVIAALHLSC
jgi:hypothetical protein